MPHNGTFPGGGEREEDCNIDGDGSNPLSPVLQLAAFVVVAAVGFVLTLVGDCRVAKGRPATAYRSVTGWCRCGRVAATAPRLAAWVDLSFLELAATAVYVRWRRGGGSVLDC